jgi:hypothetical protein
MVHTPAAVLVTSPSPHQIFTSTFASLNLLRYQSASVSGPHLLRYQGRVSFARMACSAPAPSLVFVVLPEAQLRIIAWSASVGCQANEPGSAQSSMPVTQDALKTVDS